MTETAALPRKPFHLGGGSHAGPSDGACFNELAAMLAGEPFSDAPKCVSPVIRRIGMRLNDRLDDEHRQLLRPFVLRSLGTAEDGRDEERRQMCNEWLLHNALPDLLDRAGRKEAADKLRALPGDLAVEGVRRALYEARDEAWAARRSAVDRLKERILEELRKREVPAADAAAAAVAAAVADAAAAAVADADAAAAAAAAAAAVADAAAAAVAAAAAAAELKPGEDRYWKIRSAVYDAIYAKVREKAKEIVGERNDEMLKSALELLDRMLPPAPIKLPVIDYADVVCAAPEELAA